MEGLVMELLPLLAYAPVLVWAAANDVARMRIPNAASLAGVALFILALPLLGWPEAGWRLLAAGTVFGLGLALWARGLFGAGDVKLLSALLLLVPSAALPLFANLLAAGLLVGLLAVTGLRASGALRRTGWVSMRARGQFPMGFSIALAGLALPVVLAWIAHP